MTRGKILLQPLEDISARKVSFKKRSQGLLKKIEELSILCNVDVCAIMISPFDDDQTFWPSSHLGIQKVMERFRDLPESEQEKNMFDTIKYNREILHKLKEQCRRQELRNKEKDIYHQINKHLNEESFIEENSPDIDEIIFIAQRKLKELEMKRNSLKDVI
ncbi:hypothetical protein LIER_25727 [Lithospermum erythrorhizon]|uniref:MADS-box domain-containing protein n=1 Tax=Lithospermum erythrorhizon TaxID=34254 RepID=A0AAV3R9V5_LITER